MNNRLYKDAEQHCTLTGVLLVLVIALFFGMVSAAVQ